MNSEIILNQSIINFEDTSPSAQALIFTVCPNCNHIPYISINTSTYTSVDIECTNCNQTQSMPITEYISFLENQAKKNDSNGKYCECRPSHNKEGKKAERFCVQCHQWLCNECTKIHYEIKATKEHFLIEYSFNEKVMCGIHPTRPYDYFCKKDNKHLCSECYNEHKDHEGLVKIKEFVNNEDLVEINTKIAEQKERIEKENEKIKNTIVDLLKEQIKEVEEAYEENKTINNNLYNLISKLYDNASFNLDNYYIRWNLRKNTHFNNNESHCKLNDTSIDNIQNIVQYFKTNFFVSSNDGLGHENIKQENEDANKGEETDKGEVKEEDKKENNIVKENKTSYCSHFIRIIIYFFLSIFTSVSFNTKIHCKVK